MMRYLALIGILASLLLAASPSSLAAAPLAPSKPSQAVSGIGTGLLSSPCPGLTIGLQITLLGQPGGTTVPFAIPAKSVLVATSFDFYVTGADANRNVLVQFFARHPASAPKDFGNLAMAGGLSDADGTLVGTAQLPAGLVIKSPAVPCGVASSGDLTLLVIHGFFAKDK